MYWRQELRTSSIMSIFCLYRTSKGYSGKCPGINSSFIFCNDGWTRLVTTVVIYIVRTVELLFCGRVPYALCYCPGQVRTPTTIGDPARIRGPALNTSTPFRGHPFRQYWVFRPLFTQLNCLSRAYVIVTTIALLTLLSKVVSCVTNVWNSH